MVDTDTLLIIFSGVLLAVIVAWAVVFAVAERFKRRYLVAYSGITIALQEAYDHLQALRQFALHAPSDNDPPYGPLVAELNVRLDRAHEGNRACVAQADVLAHGQPLVPARLQDMLILAPSQMRPWRNHLALVQQLAVKVESMQQLIGDALHQCNEIHGLPVTMAGRVRSIWNAQDRIAKIVQLLQLCGVNGEALDTVAASAQSYRQVLTQLPEYYRQDSDDVVMANATVDTVRDAWQKVGLVERPVYEALRRVQGWQTSYDEAKNMIGVLESELAAGELVLKQLPDSIDASRHSAEFEELRDTTGVIQSTWRVPDVQHLSDLASAASLQTTAIQQWTVGVMSVHKTFQGLEQAIMANAKLIDSIDGMMVELAKPPLIAHDTSSPGNGSASHRDVQRRSLCCVAWHGSAEELQQLRTLHAAIGATTLSRDAIKLAVDLDRALDLGSRADALEVHIHDVRDSHRQLMTLIETPELKTRDKWFHEVAAVHIDVSNYSRDNWTDQDAVSTLKTDAMSLLKREQDLRPLTNSDAVSEDDIESWIVHAGGYVRERRVLQARLESIARKLLDMLRTEKAAQSDIMQMQAVLGKLDHAIASGNLSASAVQGAWNETMSLRDDGRRLADMLEDRANGIVAEKAAAVAQWQQDCIDGVTALLSAMKAEAETSRQNLAAQVEALVEIAPLDTEPSMMTAKQLLNEVQARLIGAKPNPGGSGSQMALHPLGIDMNALTALVELVNSTYTRCMRLSEALDELEHRIVAQLDPRVTRLDAAHAAAVDTLKELQALQRTIPPVKPLQVTCEEADQMNELFNQAEAGLEDMTANGRTLKSVVSRLDGLIQQFQHVANHGAGAQSDVEQDLARLRNVWEQYNQWTRQLRRFHEIQAKTDRELLDEVESRMVEVDQYIQDIQRRYKGRALSLDAASRELENLLKSTCRGIEVQRATGVEVISPQTIMNA